jgi:hypothetical protein
VTSLFPCQLVEFPIKYLGIPLSVAKLPRSALQLLVDRVVDRLKTWKGRLLCRSGRLTLIKMTLSTIPIYTSISLGLPPCMHKALNKIMTAFLWMGTNMVKGGKCLVAWKCIQRLLHLGGLGVLDLSLFGTALRTRWLWLQRMDPTRPWASMNVVEYKQTTTFFNASVCFILGNRETSLF